MYNFKTKKVMTLYNKISEDFSENFIGYSALAIIASTCLGSIAVMAVLLHGHHAAQMFMVFLVVAACSAHNASIITVQKPAIVLKLLIVSLMTSLLIIIGNYIF